MQAIMQVPIEVNRAAIIAVQEAENSVRFAKSMQVISRIGDSVLKQPTFNWKQQRNTKYYITSR